MKYQPFDIVMDRLKYGARVFAIVEVRPDDRRNPYVGVLLDRGPLNKRYTLSEENILAKIGTLDPTAMTLDPTQPEHSPDIDWLAGQHFARLMADRAADELDRRRWTLLSTLKPGDPIVLRHFMRHGSVLETHRFQEILTAGQKYRFTAVNANGTVYRWTMESVHVEPVKDSMA